MVGLRGCLEEIFAGIAEVLEPEIAALRATIDALPAATLDTEVERLLRAAAARLDCHTKLAATVDTGANPATVQPTTPALLLAAMQYEKFEVFDENDEDNPAKKAQFEEAQTDALCFLAEIGGMAAVNDIVQESEMYGAVLVGYPSLLSHPSLLNLASKRAWLSHRLKEVVGPDPTAAGLDLHASRANLLDGLCDQLGVNEQSGQVSGAALPGPLSIQFLGENGVGDGVRREWFEQVVAEIVDEDKGLFLSKDGGGTLTPNPHSALAHGADHLSYFALLGRTSGLALFHGENIPAPWGTGFAKAAFGFPIVPEDIESVDPELYVTP